MATNTYLKLFGVHGNGTDADHEGWFDVDSLDLSSMPEYRSRPRGIVPRQEVTFTSSGDGGGNQAFSLLDKIIPSAVFEIFKVGNDKPVLLVRLSLTDVVLTDFKYTLIYRKAQFTYGSPAQLANEKLHAAARPAVKKK